MTDAPQKPFWTRKRWIAVAVLAVSPLAAASITCATLISLRRVPSSLASPYDLFLVLIAIAAFNAAVSVVIPSVAATRLSEGRAAARTVAAVGCGAAGLLVYVLACFAARTFVAH